MNDFIALANLDQVFEKKIRLPTVVMWNRLEGRPRAKNFTRALKAEVRDPLWLITRQWQMGEFIADDAGSPVSAKIAWRTDTVTSVRAGDATLGYDANELPLEPVIEARPIPLMHAGRPHDLDIRLALGQRWQKLLERDGHTTLVTTFRTEYAFVAPSDTAEADFPITAHAAAWQTATAIAGRAIDGGKLWLHLEKPGALASDGLGLSGTQKDAIDVLGNEFLSWARKLYIQPAPTWQPKHLEYSAALDTARGTAPAALTAPEYRGGHLDWYDFDAAAPPRNASPPEAATPTHVTSFMPAAIQFDGMPNTRHWAFEEGVTNFGAIDPDTTDIAKLLLIEFGLVFANDWFLLPLELPIGTLTDVRGLAVTNVFGERFWIAPAVDIAGPVESSQMFQLTHKGARDHRLFLPATTPAGLESQPVESVSFVRDEVSNMVWAIEMTVQTPDGSSRRGRELSLELHAKHQAAVTPTSTPPGPENDASIRYTLMRSVPEHWIPFIPVHIDDDNREIQLQRAAMPRLLEGTEGTLPKKIAPRTTIVRQGLDEDEPKAYYVAEEEVERAGTVIETKWQRCRWLKGRVVTWLSHQRKVGRGEVASGLAFDVLTPKAPTTES